MQLLCSNSECGKHYDNELPRRKNLDYCRALHAEENAILQISKHGGTGLQGATIFVTTFPCALCAKKIVNCDIMQVVFAETYNVQEAVELFRKAGNGSKGIRGFHSERISQSFCLKIGDVTHVAQMEPKRCGPTTCRSHKHTERVKDCRAISELIPTLREEVRASAWLVKPHLDQAHPQMRHDCAFPPPAA